MHDRRDPRDGRLAPPAEIAHFDGPWGRHGGCTARPAVESFRLQELRIRRTADVATARDRTRAAAEALGLEADDVSRIATAAAEVARAIIEHGSGALGIDALMGRRSGIALVFSTERRLAARTDVSWDPIRAAQSLSDAMEQGSGGPPYVLRLVKHAPPGADVTARLDHAVEALGTASADESSAAVRRQNRELARLLDELRRRGRELERMNHELQNANNQVTAAMLKLVELARRKDELAAAMAHDLRSPLAAVKGAIDLLAGGMAGQLTDEQRRYVEVADRAARHIIELVNNLLDSSLLDAGLARLEPTVVHLADVVEELGPTVAFLAREKGISYEVDIPGVLPPVYADRKKLGQILSNLITNAVKFTHAGGRVRVSAELTPDAMVAVDVADTGVGIPPSLRSLLFDRFHRSHSRGTRGERGTGLGLYICKQLVELHGGTIAVASEVGRGTTFRFTTPCRAARSAAARR